MACTTIGSVGYAAYLNNQGPLFYAGLMLAGAQLYRILREVDYSSRSSCWRAFVRSGTVGLLIWGAATVDYIATWASN
jgi:4-hydroxybenzoate polyprenyltransferase